MRWGTKRSVHRLYAGAASAGRSAAPRPAVKAAVCPSLLLGFTPSAIDIGHVNNARAGLQRTAKVPRIVPLLTNGNTSQTCNPVLYDEFRAHEEVNTTAHEAPAHGGKAYAVNVGCSANTDLVQEIAGLTEGGSFHAGGSRKKGRSQLEAMFQKRGAAQPIALID